MSTGTFAPAPLLQAALRRERLRVLLALGAIAALCWAWLVPAALDMYGAMDGLSAWMTTARWDLRYAVLIFLMWSVMMAAMMLPSATPAILTFGRVVHASHSPQAPVQRQYAFAAGYLVAWTAFSLAATVLQWALWRAGWLDPMMQASRQVGAVLLLIAGVYQWTALKRACLTRCRSPLQFLSQRWRSGRAGALRMGIEHGAYCVGCCWGLMLLLFTGGVMSLAWIGGIAAFVLVEKLAPAGVQGGRLSGALLVATGAWMLLSQ